MVFPTPGSLCMGFSRSLYFAQRIKKAVMSNVASLKGSCLVHDRGGPAVFTPGEGCLRSASVSGLNKKCAYLYIYIIYIFVCVIICAYFTLSTNARLPGCHIHRRRQNPQQREKETGALTTWWVTGVFSWGTETGAHPPLIGMGDHRFVKCAPTCDRERSWKSETLRWKVALDSE